VINSWLLFPTHAAAVAYPCSPDPALAEAHQESCVRDVHSTALHDEENSQTPQSLHGGNAGAAVERSGAGRSGEARQRSKAAKFAQMMMFKFGFR
jgi:hypothetical protein